MIEDARKDCQALQASWRRTQIERMLSGVEMDKGGPEHYWNAWERRLQGCTAAFRRRVLARYCTEVLPPQEAEELAEKAHMELHDALSDATGGMELEPVQKLTAAIQDGGLTVLFSAAGLEVG